MRLAQYLRRMAEEGGSDLHLKAGLPPVVRVDGRLRQTDFPTLAEEDLETLALEVLSERKREEFRAANEAEASFTVEGMGRYRVSVYRQRGMVSLAIRRILSVIPTFEALGLPPVAGTLAAESRGLVLVTGPAGTGKTTSIAAMLDWINTNRSFHVVTIEDPIEVVHDDKASVIEQREVGEDTASYSSALRAAMRQDPDVIFIGEIRDRETVEAAIQAAETGHLVISTLHTLDATETVNRVLDLFPSEVQRQARLSLAGTLKGILSQRLVPRADGTGRALAVEVLLNTGRVAERIIDPDRTWSIPEILAEGEFYGMQTFDQALLSLVGEGTITAETAEEHATNPHDLRLALRAAQLA